MVAQTILSKDVKSYRGHFFNRETLNSLEKETTRRKFGVEINKNGTFCSADKWVVIYNAAAKEQFLMQRKTGWLDRYWPAHAHAVLNLFHKQLFAFQ